MVKRQVVFVLMLKDKCNHSMGKLEDKLCLFCNHSMGELKDKLCVCFVTTLWVS